MRSVDLTVRLLSGEQLLELSVGDHLQAGELKVKIEASANLAVETCCTLLWGSCELEGALTLWELGMCGAEEVVAVCTHAIEGDFEDFDTFGVYTYDSCAMATHMRFEVSGIATLSTSSEGGEETRTFRYTLGEAEEGCVPGMRGVPGMLRRVLRLEQLFTDGERCGEHSSGAAAVFEGWLEFDPSDPIQRRVCIDGLGPDRWPKWREGRLHLDREARLHLEDVRALQRRGELEAQMRVQLFYQYQRSEREWERWCERESERLHEEEVWVFRRFEKQMRNLRSVFARPLCQHECSRRERRLKPRHRRHNQCCCDLACRVCQGDGRAAAALVRSRTRRAERDLKVAV